MARLVEVVPCTPPPNLPAMYRERFGDERDELLGTRARNVATCQFLFPARWRSNHSLRAPRE